jgi:hypothetical protein
MHVHIPGKWDTLRGAKVSGLDNPAAILNSRPMFQTVVFVKDQSLSQQLWVVEGLKQIFRGKDALDLGS